MNDQTHTAMIATCCTCAERFDEGGFWKRTRVNSMIHQRRIWMDAHYGNTSHHKFEVQQVTRETMSIARVRDPNQGVLSDESGFSRFQVGES